MYFSLDNPGAVEYEVGVCNLWIIVAIVWRCLFTGTTKLHTNPDYWLPHKKQYVFTSEVVETCAASRQHHFA
jgi:hypothetical protein